LTKLKIIKFIVSLIFPCVGVACIFFPVQMSGILPYVVGGGMIITGAVHFFALIFSAVLRQPIAERPDIRFVALILGIIIILPRTSSLVLIGTVWGLYGIWESCMSFHAGVRALSLRENSLGHFCAAALRLGIALLLLLDPTEHFVEHIVVLGFDILIDTCRGPGSEKLKMAGDAFEHIKSDAADMTNLRRSSARPGMHVGDLRSASPTPEGELKPVSELDPEKEAAPTAENVPASPAPQERTDEESTQERTEAAC
jgi:uncharacterized membrane protein HdeD (DUF308 family)